uniref:Uncharacterized protein n=1 Tax=Arcella intermedia TaxID=1963864 RepID=A0A6B2LK98_9EUKA
MDTAGQEEFSALRDQYMKNGEGFLLGYSVTSKVSFQDINNFYQQILRVKGTDWFPAVLVGNKCDLEKSREVSKNEGIQWAKEKGIPFFETSAKTGLNVKQSLLTLITMAHLYKISHQRIQGVDNYPVD